MVRRLVKGPPVACAGAWLRLPDADGEQQVGPEGLVSGLDRQDMIATGYRVVELPALDGLERDGDLSRLERSAIRFPDGRIVVELERVVGGHTHRIDGFDGDGRRQDPEHLVYRD